MPTKPRPRSLADLVWSPARMPRPPAEMGSDSWKPNSAEKYATGFLCSFGALLMAPGLLVVQVIVEIVEHVADAVGKARFLQMHAQFVFGDFAEHGHGIVPEVLPAARRKPLKKILRLLIPAPPEIAGQLVKAGNQFIQFRACQRFLHKIRFFLIAAGFWPACARKIISNARHGKQKIPAPRTFMPRRRSSASFWNNSA